ncbi:MAG: cyclic nucleotide-binding domain-containing protein [Proteobacteria bacterium]|nr:cyclic nucleotide-binding domain-containing protein [Pseudomonadota bacterium]MBU1710744.1 cyclic nucleotide-binding domain-containing protein [Pseudomonadota bacterium]
MADSGSGVSLWGNLFKKSETWHEMVAALWAKTPLFRKIPQKEIIRLVKNMHPRHFKPGEVIFRTSDQGAGAAMVLSGKVEIRAGEVVLTTLGPGDFFGEVSLVLDERRTADAVAVEDSELAFFLRIDLEEWIDRVPRHGARLGTNLAHVLAHRLLHANRMLSQRGM